MDIELRCCTKCAVDKPSTEFAEICAVSLVKSVFGKGQLNKTKVAHVDHCHKTGTIRGMLCANCNTGLGMLKDSVKILNNAVAYLEKYKRST